MGKFDGILLCTDLDGTLYRNDKSVSAENRDAIEHFKREGGLFTFITGRSPHYSQDAYRAAQPNVPFGCMNGGAVYDGERHTYIWMREMPADVMEIVADMERQLPTVGIQIAGFDKAYFLKDNDVMSGFRRITGVPFLGCTYDNLPTPFAKVIFGAVREEEMLEIERVFRAHPRAGEFDFIRSEKTLCEILPKGTHKGVSLVKLTEYLGVDPAKTVAVGDYNNDVGMLKAAGLGVAVANASAAALAAADVVTVSNEEHAIAQVIKDLECGKYVL